MLLLIALNTPFFQKYLTQKVTTWLTNEIDYPISVQNVSVDWFDAIELEHLEVRDTKDSVLISVESLMLDYKITNLLFFETPTIEEAIVLAPKVVLIKHNVKEILNINAFIIALKELFASENKTKNTDKLFQINSIIIKNGFFGFHNLSKDKILNQLDYFHFNILNIDGQFTDFFIQEGNIEFNIDQLSGYEKTQDRAISNFVGHFLLSPNKLELSNLKAYIGDSYISNYVAFEYDSISYFSDFNNKIILNTNLDSTVIFSKDLEMFAPVLHKIQEKWTVNGKSLGTVNSFSTSKLSIAFGKKSIIEGKFSFDGLPVFYETFMDLKVFKSSLFAKDLIQYFPPSTHSVVNKFSHIKADASFIGFPLDFVAKGDFHTSLGYLKSDINLKLFENGGKPIYEGNLRTINFDLGKVLGYSDYIGKISMIGKIEGKGLTANDISMKLDVDISKFMVLDYNYSNIKTNASIRKNLFEGVLDVNDENLKMYLEGTANFNSKLPIINVKTQIPYSNIQELFHTELPGSFSGGGILNFSGFTVDELNGSSVLKDLKMNYGDKSLKVDSVFIISTIDGNHRYFDMHSSVADVLLNGDFNFTTLSSNLQDLVEEYVLFFQNDPTQLNNYYATKRKVAAKSNAYFKIEFKDIDSLVMLYSQKHFHIEPNSFISGNLIQNDSLSKIEFETELKDVSFDDLWFSTISIQGESYKSPFNNKIKSNFKVSSNEQKLISQFKTKDFVTTIDWDNEKIGFNTFMKQKEKDNDININGEISFLKSSIVLLMDSLKLNFNQKLWQIQEKNSVNFLHKSIIFNNFSLFSDTQSVSLNGVLSTLATDTLDLIFNDFNLNFLDPFLPKPMGGILNGKMSFSEIYTKLKAKGQLNVKDFIFANSEFGDANGLLEWINDEKSINTSFDFIKDNKKIVHFSGRISPFEEQKNLNLLAKIYPVDLNIIEPIFKDYATNFVGVATGKIWIKGSFKKPIYNGHIYCENAGLHVNYLNTDYKFNDFIYLEDDMFTLKNLTLQDEYKNKAQVNGNIIHSNFKDYYFDLFGYFKEFQLLNTTNVDNELYYGTAYATGSYSINGPLKDVTIWTEAKSNKETHLHIPLSSYEEVEQSTFIFFKQTEKEVEKATVLNSDFGLKLDFNLDVTPDTYFEIIIDEKAGDIIRGRGKGNLKLGIDTRGDVSLFGNYELEQGAYNFTLMNLVNKEFSIQKGSTINWTGSPYNGELKIKALYQQFASLKPIIDTTLNAQIFEQYPALKTTKFPVDVQLGLTGELMHPKIDLNIDIQKGYPLVIDPSVKSFKSIIENNEQEMNKQVFSLMILKQFSSINTGDNLNLGNTASNSVSELLSNQLSYWMSQVDDNLEIDIDLNSLDQDALNTFQLRLSYTFLDGKLRVTRDGNFTNYNNTTSTTSIVGEWTVEYLLSKDGKLRLKMYNKNNQNSLFSGLQNSSSSSAGMSLLFTENFNSLSELFEKSKNKQVDRKNK